MKFKNFNYTEYNINLDKTHKYIFYHSANLILVSQPTQSSLIGHYIASIIQLEFKNYTVEITMGIRLSKRYQRFSIQKKKERLITAPFLLSRKVLHSKSYTDNSRTYQ